jgi:leader peptidase (prepilin peptidase)/N-methyltransferase
VRDGRIDSVYAALVTIAAIVGVAIGSFLNVVIYRVPRGESVVRPASHCPACGRPIRARHNVPVLSYVVLRGRCADCGVHISARYPLIEASTGLLFAATTAWALSSGHGPLLPALLYLAAAGVALAAIDLDVHRLPNAIVLPSYPVVAVLLTAAAWWTGDWWSLGRAAIGAAALFAFYLLLVLVYPAGMGWGDVKLAGVLGGVLAFLSWSALVIGAFAGFVFGAVVAVVVIATRRGTGKTALPFGPFMLLGVVTGVLFGAELASAYWGVLGV